MQYRWTDRGRSVVIGKTVDLISSFGRVQVPFGSGIKFHSPGRICRVNFKAG